MVSWMEGFKAKVSSLWLGMTLPVRVAKVMQISQIERFHKSRNVGVLKDRK